MRRLKTVIIKDFKQDRGETPYFLFEYRIRLKNLLKTVKSFLIRHNKSEYNGISICELKINLM